MAQPLISIIVVNWNGVHLLDDCLSALERQTWQNREFILVDNGSKDGSAERLRCWAGRLPKTQLLCLDQNTGFCRGNNLGIAKAHGEWLALINNDAIAEPNWLEELARFRDTAPRVGMVGSKILFQDPPGIIDKAGHLIYWDGQNRGRGTMEQDKGQYDSPEEILWPDACAALYRKQLINETGGFDESFFAYGDDADLGMRARLLGWKAWYAPTAVVRHRHSATAGAYSPLKIMLVERNRVLLALKNFPLRLLLQNPYWSAKRFLWHGYSATRRTGSASRFMQTHGAFRLVVNLLWSYASTLKQAPGALKRRRRIQRTKLLTNAEVMEFLRRYQIDVRELTLRD